MQYKIIPDYSIKPPTVRVAVIDDEGKELDFGDVIVTDPLLNVDELTDFLDGLVIVAKAKYEEKLAFEKRELEKKTLTGQELTDYENTLKNVLAEYTIQ